MSRVLVVDDEPAVRFALVEVLEERGHTVVAAASGEDALAHAGAVDVVVTDLMMPGLDGLGVVRAVRQRAPGVPVIMLTARGSERIAVEAMQAGAAHYLVKPFDVDELALVIARAVEHADLRRGAVRAAAERVTGRALVGDGPAMRALVARIERLAPRDVTALVRGESGTGKELVSALLHALGPRAAGPFVRFNCAAIPAELADAELFGHAKGAFTGAVDARAGYFASAHRGTLVLDEIAELPLAIQPKLLRALQDGEIQPVGGTPRRVDVRIIACTHRDLAERVRARAFREDLYFRLAVVELAVPPLRERREDIPQLARAIAARLGAAWGLDVRLSDALIEALSARPWPGNVRELENVLARMLADSETGALDADALAAAAPATGAHPPVEPAASATHEPFRARVDAFERALITEAMTAAGGNRAEAARRLGLSRVTLLDRMKRLGLG